MGMMDWLQGLESGLEDDDPLKFAKVTTRGLAGLGTEAFRPVAQGLGWASDVASAPFRALSSKVAEGYGLDPNMPVESMLETAALNNPESIDRPLADSPYAEKAARFGAQMAGGMAIDPTALIGVAGGGAGLATRALGKAGLQAGKLGRVGKYLSGVDDAILATSPGRLTMAAGVGAGRAGAVDEGLNAVKSFEETGWNPETFGHALGAVSSGVMSQLGSAALKGTAGRSFSGVELPSGMASSIAPASARPKPVGPLDPRIPTKFEAQGADMPADYHAGLEATAAQVKNWNPLERGAEVGVLPSGELAVRSTDGSAIAIIAEGGIVKDISTSRPKSMATGRVIKALEKSGFKLPDQSHISADAGGIVDNYRQKAGIDTEPVPAFDPEATNPRFDPDKTQPYIDVPEKPLLEQGDIDQLFPVQEAPKAPGMQSIAERVLMGEAGGAAKDLITAARARGGRGGVGALGEIGPRMTEAPKSPSKFKDVTGVPKKRGRPRKEAAAEKAAVDKGAEIDAQIREYEEMHGLGLIDEVTAKDYITKLEAERANISRPERPVEPQRAVSEPEAVKTAPEKVEAPEKAVEAPEKASETGEISATDMAKLDELDADIPTVKKFVKAQDAQKLKFKQDGTVKKGGPEVVGKVGSDEVAQYHTVKNADGTYGIYRQGKGKSSADPVETVGRQDVAKARAEELYKKEFDESFKKDTPTEKLPSKPLPKVEPLKGDLGEVKPSFQEFLSGREATPDLIAEYGRTHGRARSPGQQNAVKKANKRADKKAAKRKELVKKAKAEELGSDELAALDKLDADISAGKKLPSVAGVPEARMAPSNLPKVGKAGADIKAAQAAAETAAAGPVPKKGEVVRKGKTAPLWEIRMKDGSTRKMRGTDKDLLVAKAKELGHDAVDAVPFDQVKAERAKAKERKPKAAKETYKVEIEGAKKPVSVRAESAEAAMAMVEKGGGEPKGAYTDAEYKVRKAKGGGDSGGKGGDPPDVKKAADSPEPPDGSPEKTSWLREMAAFPRAVKSSWDFSAPLRQAVFYSINPRYAKTTAKALGKMFKSFATEKNFVKIETEIKSRPNAELADKAGLQISDPKNFGKKEEFFQSKWAEVVPGVKRSERAYTAYLNKVRADVFDTLVKSIQDEGKDFKSHPEEFKAIAEYVNVTTGAGNIKGFTDSKIARTALYSPKFAASRIKMLNPVYWAKLPKSIRARALQDLGLYTASAMSILGLASMSGADVELDPTSPDFGKAKWGNTRVDLIGGGLLPYIRFAATTITGQKKSSTGKRYVADDMLHNAVRSVSGKFFGAGAGKKKGQGRFDWTREAFMFGRSKLAPVPALGTDAASGRDIFGQPLTPGKTAKNLIAPMYGADVFETIRDEGWTPQVAFALGMGSLGAGVQSYDATKRKAGRPAGRTGRRKTVKPYVAPF